MSRQWFKYNIKNKTYSRENRKTPTKSEWLVWNMILKNKKLGYRFLRQKLIWNYIVDFYCAKLWLIIELDWKSHDDKQEYDKTRDEYLESLGLKVIRYNNDDNILWNLEWLMNDLKYKIECLEK